MARELVKVRPTIILAGAGVPGFAPGIKDAGLTRAEGGRLRSPRRSRSAGEGRGARPWGPGPHPARTDAGRDVRPGRLDPEGEGRGRGAVRARLLGLGDLRGQHLREHKKLQLRRAA